MNGLRFLCVVVVLALSGCEPAPPPGEQPLLRPAKVMTIGGSELSFRRSMPGVVRAGRRVDLAFQVPGQLRELGVKDGERVSRGQLLGRLDARDYRSNANAARAQLVEAQSNFNRAEELLKKKFISAAEYDRLQANRDVARSALEKAEKALQDCELLAPFDGVVARSYVENFEDIQAKQPILSLQDNSELEVVINVAESILIKHPGGNPELSFFARIDSRPDLQIPAYIKEFATEADPKTRTFDYVLGLTKPRDLKLLPGMTVSIEIASRSQFNTDLPLTVPVAAVVANSEGQTVLWLVDEQNRVHSRAVSLGELHSEGRIQVFGEIAFGERVVVAGANTMREGLQIKPISEVAF